MRKIVSILALFVVMLVSLSVMVSALSVDDNMKWGDVRINGDFVEVGDNDGNSEVLSVEEGQTINIRVGLEAAGLQGAEDVQVVARISGYEYSDKDGESLTDSAHLDRINAGTTKYFDLSIDLPNRLDRDTYWLRLSVFDKNTASLESIIQLYVEPTRHGIEVADVSFSPGNTVQAGRSLLTTVLLENFGDRPEKDVKVTVAIPSLGVSATEFVDVIPTDNNNIEKEDVPEMFLPIPASATEGDYEVVVTARYDDLREVTTHREMIHVVGDARFQTVQDTLVLAVGPELQTVGAGQTATYAIALTNAGPRSKAYVLETVTGDWATASVSESLVVLEPGRNKVVYVDVAVANSAAVGEHVASVLVKSGDEVLETVSVRATVVAGKNSGSNVSLRNGLEIALIVLVVLLVIIGLIIGFSRLRKDNDEEEEQTYY